MTLISSLQIPPTVGGVLSRRRKGQGFCRLLRASGRGSSGRLAGITLGVAVSRFNSTAQRDSAGGEREREYHFLGCPQDQ